MTLTSSCFKIFFVCLIFSGIKADSDDAGSTDYDTSRYEEKRERDEETEINSLKFNEVGEQHLRGARWGLEQKDKKAINVYFAIEILDFSKINPTTREFRLDLNVKQTWNAPKLVLPLNLFKEDESNDTSVTVGGAVLHELWTPTAYIPNSRDANVETLMGQQKSVSIFKNGTVMFSSNMFTINACTNMEFHWYPMETHLCHLHLESYSFTNRNVIFNWDNETVIEPVNLPRSLKFRQYILKRPLKFVKREVRRFGRQDFYSRLTVAFVLQRQLGHFVLHTFLPTFFIVALSWFSFWLGMDAIPGRVSLLVTCLLTLVTLYSSQKVDLPPVSYVKMMDVWMSACLGFIFAAICEFVIVRYLAKDDIPKEKSLSIYINELFQPKKKKKRIEDDLRLVESRLAHGRLPAWNPSADDEYYPPSILKTHNLNSENVLRRSNDKTVRFYPSAHAQEANVQGKLEGVQRKPWQRIDRSARAAFPLLFLCFCLIFWPVLMYGDPKPASWRFRGNAEVAGVTMSQWEIVSAQDVVDRIVAMPGVHGVIITTKENQPVFTSMDNTATVTNVANFSILEQMVTSIVREVDPSDSLNVLRIRSKRFEVLLKPDPNYVIYIIQRIPKPNSINPWSKPVRTDD